MSSDDDRLARRYGIVPRPFDVALRDALVARPAPLRVSGSHGARPPAGDDAIACSIQRLPLPKGASIAWVVRQYADWLPRAASPLLRVATSADGHLDFFALGVRVLELHFSPERSTANRQMFYVEGGRLCDRAACPDRARGRFEFRAVPGRDEVVAALFDFRPSLPWWVYGLTQARVHLWVMRAFGRHLRRIAAGLARPAMPRRKGRFATRP